MKEDSIHSFKDAFGRFLKEESLEERFSEKRLIQSWGKIMGAPIANRTSKLFIKDKTLFVTLSSAPLKQELTNAKDKVLELIHKEFGKTVVDEIRFF